MSAAEGKVERGQAGAKVTVASKLPMAIILQNYRPETREFKHQGSVWNETVHVNDGGPFAVIAGTAYPNGPAPDGMELPERPQMIAGYAITNNIDKDKWDRWLEANKSTPMVKNKLVFAYPTIDGVRGVAKENRDVTSGLQALNPTDDKRLPKKTGGSGRRLAVGPVEAVG